MAGGVEKVSLVTGMEKKEKGSADDKDGCYQAQDLLLRQINWEQIDECLRYDLVRQG